MKLIDTNPIGIGTFCMGGGYYRDIKRDFADFSDDKKYIDALRYSLSLGQNHIDTAYSYGAGHTEEIIGKAIKGFKRENIYIADKIPKSHMLKESVIPAIKEMLRRLETDFLDLVYVHDVNVPEPMEGYLNGLADAVDLGLVREIGISNADLEQTKKAIRLSKYPIVANQVCMNILEREKSPDDLLEFCRKNKIQVVAYRPLQNNTFFDGIDNPDISVIAQKYEKTAYQIALNWLIKCKHVIAIPKASNKVHIKENLESLNFDISQEDQVRLDKLA